MSQGSKIRIEYDDDSLEVIQKINAVLKAHGLVLVDDDLPHEGYCIFTLQPIQPALPKRSTP